MPVCRTDLKLADSATINVVRISRFLTTKQLKRVQPLTKPVELRLRLQLVRVYLNMTNNNHIYSPKTVQMFLKNVTKVRYIVISYNTSIPCLHVSIMHNFPNTTVYLKKYFLHVHLYSPQVVAISSYEESIINT